MPGAVTVLTISIPDPPLRGQCIAADQAIAGRCTEIDSTGVGYVKADAVADVVSDDVVDGVTLNCAAIFRKDAETVTLITGNDVSFRILHVGDRVQSAAADCAAGVDKR